MFGTSSSSVGPQTTHIRHDTGRKIRHVARLRTARVQAHAARTNTPRTAHPHAFAAPPTYAVVHRRCAQPPSHPKGSPCIARPAPGAPSSQSVRRRRRRASPRSVSSRRGDATRSKTRSISGRCGHVPRNATARRSSPKRSSTGTLCSLASVQTARTSSRARKTSYRNRISCTSFMLVICGTDTVIRQLGGRLGVAWQAAAHLGQHAWLSAQAQAGNWKL